MGDNLKGKVAAVTGSGQGIGKAIALALAKEGAKVVTNNRKPGSTGLTTYGEDFEKTMTQEDKERAGKLSGDAESTAKEIKDMGGEAVPFYGDVGNFEVARQFIQAAVDNFGKIDILVNNAGTFRHNWPWEMTEADWDHVTGNKPKSAFNTIRHAAPHMMKQKWGRIINCTSVAWLGQSNHPNYSAANAGVVGLTRSVARDIYNYGITCNAFAPGAMTRAIVSLMFHAKQVERKEKVVIQNSRAVAMEIAGPEELAPFVAFLATEQAGKINGSVFAIHGGHIGLYSNPVEIKTLDKEKGKGIWTVDELIQEVPKVLLEGYESPALKPIT